MGHKHSKHDLLSGAIAVAHEGGLSRLTFGRVATHLGISDRTVVYYFPTKSDLIAEVLGALGTQLEHTLTTAFSAVGAGDVSDHRQLLRAAWPVVADKNADPVFGLYFEALGLASAGREPYRSIVPALVDHWIEWSMGLLRGDDDARRAEATAALALVDGLLLLRHTAGSDTAELAAGRLGIAIS